MAVIDESCFLADFFKTDEIRSDIVRCSYFPAQKMSSSGVRPAGEDKKYRRRWPAGIREQG
jgi:hypothetical protein